MFLSPIYYVQAGSASINTEIILRLLSFGKLSIVVMVGYIIIFRFSKSQEEGVYGYWLALGANRSMLFVYSLVAISLYSAFGIFLGIALPVSFLAFSMKIGDVLVLFLIIFISQLFLVTFVLLLEELVEWSELSLITVLFPYFMINAFVEVEDIPGSLFYPEFAFFHGNWLLPVIIQLVITLIMGYAAYSMHLTKDMELGG